MPTLVNPGQDASGNNNNWTATNINWTSSSSTTYDIMSDVPTLTDEDTSNFATLNPLTGNATLNSANLNLTGSEVSTLGTIAFPTSGKWYFEMDCIANVSTSNNDGVGIATLPIYDSGTTYYIYRTSGVKQNSGGSNQSYGSSYTTGDTIGVAYDADAGTLVFYKNGVSQGTAYTGLSGLFFPVVYARAAATTPTLGFNAGQRPFADTPPAGYKKLNTYNLPDSAIVDGSKHMNTITYTGDGTAKSFTGIGFQPDLTWFKVRSGGTHAPHQFDVVRGGNIALSSSTNSAEVVNDADGYITSFDSDGFTVNGGGWSVNKSAIEYVAWNFLAGNSSGVSNSVGSIPSTVSVNTTAGFSIVKYSGNSTSGATVGHGLGVAPEFYVTKTRDVTGTWIAMHVNAIDADQYLGFNTQTAVSNSSAAWNSTYADANVVTLGNLGNSNGNYDYIMYCFAPVEGFSKFGSYTGNASADGPFVYTGFRPSWIMRKRITGSTNADWIVQDTTRNSYNESQTVLYTNESTVENTVAGLGIDILSNGFKVRNSNGLGNASGTTYAYLAFAENPFKNSLAR